MSRLTVLCAAPRREPDPLRPGGSLPYGMDVLADHIDLAWVDLHRGAREARVQQRIAGVIRRLSPGRRGWELARAARRLTPGPVLSVFEDAGLAFARRQRGRSGGPHVMVSCWLAQDVQDHPAAVRSLRASMSSVAAVCVYSSNQPGILSSELHIPVDRIHVVPFGVDTAYYDRRLVAGPGGGAGVVAVGSDSRRDYATLFAVAERSGIPMTVACRPRNLVGLTVPPLVDLVSVFDTAYRELLHRADVVVTPTTAPAYPSGQSVVLEAMSMGKATITTDSPAMRDYVADGGTGILVPRGDPDAVGAAITRVLSDDRLRGSLGDRAERDVRERFDLRRQWDAVAHVLAEVTG
ncbi:glycosyltransferase family 4 protein [Microbacterium sp. 179-B 1A2 NHS]|uniref:glycosyltransferase family 4 protein n=1 Tax=Microbacterium sp. 179-B 1A2 NHS TaxID=3142383 RepID=UPI0039A1A13C